MLQKIFATGILLSSFVCGFSQDVAVATTATSSTAASAPAPEEEKKSAILISGSADAYYRYDFAKTRMNNLTSFTNSHNSFELGMASVKLEHKGNKIGAVVDLGFGTRAKEFSYNETGITQAIKQLYVSYSPASWIKFTAGTWATHVGYELLDPQLNRNYSMSYMFTNGPFSHTGLKADLTKGKHGFMVGVSNATDFRSAPDGKINRKFLLAQYSVAFSDNVKLYVNYVGGKAPDTSKINQFDAVLTAKISNKFSVGYNGTLNKTQLWNGTKNISSKSWWGSALYVNIDPTSWFGLTLREEYFSDKNQLKLLMAPGGSTMFASTLSANFKIESFTIIPEFRVDKSSKSIFVDGNGNAKKSFSSFLLAVVYAF